MDMKLAGKTALVTGASSVGLGRAIALGLAREGVKVTITARRGDLLRAAAQEIKAASGHEPYVIEGDLYQPETPARIAAEALEKLGRVDILVNAAGGSRPIPFATPAAVWDESMLLNFARLRELTHAILAGMMEKKWGRVISLTGTSEPYNINAANPAKAAIHAWTKGLSREMGKHVRAADLFGIATRAHRARAMAERMRRDLWSPDGDFQLCPPARGDGAGGGGHVHLCSLLVHRFNIVCQPGRDRRAIVH